MRVRGSNADSNAAARSAADEAFSRILLYANSLAARSRSSNLGKTTMINKGLLHPIGAKTLCFPNSRGYDPCTQRR